MDRTKQQHAFTPEAGVTAQARAHRYFTEIEAAKKEGIENFTGWSLGIAVGVIRQGIGAGAVVIGRVIGIGSQAVIGGIGPSGGTHAKAILLVDHQVHFAQQVDTIGHRLAFGKVAVAVIAGGVVDDGGVTLFHAHAIVVAHGVVPAQNHVGVAKVDFDRLGGTHRAQGEDTPGNGSKS